MSSSEEISAGPAGSPAGAPGRILVGTSGYSFQDWVGPFYPPGTRPSGMLEYYATCFDAVEINSTYYRLPPPKVFESAAGRTPPGFRFTVKFPGDVTHKRDRGLEIMPAYLAAIAPLEDAGRFRGTLAQFPWSFRDSAENREYIRAVREAHGDRPLFFEFRHDSWARRGTFELLDGMGAGFCAVDEPRLSGLFPPLVRPTGPTGYVRFHGRNAGNWWEGDSRSRYDYLYTDDELKEWLAAIHRLAERSKETYIFFNNCHGGQAAENAVRMRELLARSPSGFSP